MDADIAANEGATHLNNLPDEPRTIIDGIDGYVDVATLKKIHDGLEMSEDQGDRVLAAWVKKNYLWVESSTISHQPIKDREGFQNLDRAYKRVRLLTNRTQDKWPFFDRNRNFRKIPPNQFRKSYANRDIPSTSAPISPESAKRILEMQTSSSPINSSASKYPASTDTSPEINAGPSNTTSSEGRTSTRSSFERPRNSDGTYAEPEPVETNLDATPFRGIKRKRGRSRAPDGTFILNDSPNKIERGGLGGRGGRGGGRSGKSRLSQSHVLDSDDGLVTSPEAEMQNGGQSRTPELATATPDSSPEPRRKSARKTKRVSGTEFSESNVRATSEETAEMMVDVSPEDDMVTGHRETTHALGSVQAEAKKFLDFGIASVQASKVATLSAQDAQLQITSTTPVTPPKSAALTTAPVEFFARAQTTNGPFEVAIPWEAFTGSDTAKLPARVQKFAQWKSNKGARSSVTFEVWLEIIASE